MSFSINFVTKQQKMKPNYLDFIHNLQKQLFWKLSETFKLSWVFIKNKAMISQPKFKKTQNVLSYLEMYCVILYFSKSL